MDFQAKAIGGAYDGQVIGPSDNQQFQFSGRVMEHPFQQRLFAWTSQTTYEYYYWQQVSNRDGTYGQWAHQSVVSENGVLKI